MLKTIDRIFGWLLVVGACGHTVGTFLWTPFMSDIFIWSLGGALAARLLAAFNLVRASRAPDRTLAIITAVGSACWALLALGFGMTIHNVLDPRPLMHCLTSTGLVFFSIRTIKQSYDFRAQVGEQLLSTS